MDNVSFTPLGDQAITVTFGSEIQAKTNQQVQAFRHLLKEERKDYIVDVVATFTNVTVFYDARQMDYAEIKKELSGLLTDLEAYQDHRTIYNIHLPVWYNGMDLERVSEITGLTKEEIVERHSGKPYPIYMIGFLPGFPYIGGFPEEFAIPRLEKPRQQVPKGSVGIVNAQSGIYPVSSPGGWNIIGTTPVELIRIEKQYPFYYQAGDWITFVPIDEKEYETILNDKHFEPTIEVIHHED